MQAGKLDRRVQFTRATLSDDGFGQTAVFTNYGSPVWASRRDVSDAERWAAGEQSATLMARFLVRASAFTRTITPKDRLTCDGREWSIVGIKEPEARGAIEITAVAGTD